MRDPGSDAAQRGQSLADLQLGIDALQRIQIAQRDQCAHLFAVFLDCLHAHSHPSDPTCRFQFRFCGGFAERISFQMQSLAKWMVVRENLGHTAPQELSCRSSQEFFRCGTDHHRARITREKQ